MANVVIVGTQWGDEGKAKVIDYLTEQSDLIIRFQGGANAGHTVIAHGEKFIFHMVPSGIMYPGKICIVGNGVVFDSEQFLTEVDELTSKNIEIDGRLFVSDKAQLVLPYHKLQDKASETQKEGGKIGTTCRGIGPAYADKAHRIGIRTSTLKNWDSFTLQLKANFEHKRKFFNAFYTTPFDLDISETIEQFSKIRDRLLPFLLDTTDYIFSATEQKKRLLFEGAQGTFLDIDHGTYPFVTSSNTISGSACTGSGIGPRMIDHVVGIVKTYTTRVGNGPFPTELEDEIGESIRKEGGEYGATTGRPRRCGWFDAVMVRKSAQLNGLTRLALTKLDVLDHLDEIKICTHYEIDGKKTQTFPSDLEILEKARPIYETLPGWKEKIASCKKLADLPTNTINYIKKIRELCYDIPPLLVSVGPDRSQTIEAETL